MENKLVLKKNELCFLLSLIRLMEKGVRTLTDVGSKSKISDGSKPRPVYFFRARAQNFEKGPGSTQARDQFLEKGLENWDFYVVKNTGSSRLGIKLL